MNPDSSRHGIQRYLASRRSPREQMLRKYVSKNSNAFCGEKPWDSETAPDPLVYRETRFAVHGFQLLPLPASRFHAEVEIPIRAEGEYASRFPREKQSS